MLNSDLGAIENKTSMLIGRGKSIYGTSGEVWSAQSQWKLRVLE